MSSSADLTRGADFTSLGDRLALMLVVRMVMSATVLLAAQYLPELTRTNRVDFVVMGYVFLAVTCEFLHRTLTRLTNRRWLIFVNFMLLVDGVFVQSVLAGTGHSSSAFMFLAYAHIVSVTLLIGFRTGLKMALWHSILVFTVFYLTLAGGVGPIKLDKTVADSKQLEVAQATALWLVAIVTAVFSAMNERELRRRKGELTIIAELEADVERTRRPSEIMAALNTAAVTKLKGLRSVALVAHSGTVLVIGDGASDFHLIDKESLDELGGSVAEVVKSATPIFVRELDEGRDQILATAMPGAENVAIVPMVAEGEVLGLLAVEWGKNNRVTMATIDLLSNVTGRVALSLSNTFLLAEVQRLASVDGLTGLANRRTFNSTFQKEVLRAMRSGSPMSLVLLDVDHFKSVNDNHGHQVGDQVLAESASGVAGACRGEDLPARYGGEEIVVIMPNCPPEQAHQAAERIRRALTEANKTLPGVTASAGVASLPLDGTTTTALLSAADAALYRAKETGRNRTVTASMMRGASKPAEDPSSIVVP